MTHNLKLYHCLTCGTVKRRERDAECPECCGTAMEMAGEITVTEHEPPMPRCIGPRSEVATHGKQGEHQHASWS